VEPDGFSPVDREDNKESESEVWRVDVFTARDFPVVGRKKGQQEKGTFKVDLAEPVATAAGGRDPGFAKYSGSQFGRRY
jgi:hypothetical protein